MGMYSGTAMPNQGGQTGLGSGNWRLGESGWQSGQGFWGTSGSSSSSSSTTNGSAGPKAELLERAYLRMYQRRVDLGKRMGAAALTQGTSRGLARSGQTMGEIGEVNRNTERDLQDLEAELAARIAALEGEKQEREEMSKSSGGGWVIGTGKFAKQGQTEQPGEYARGTPPAQQGQAQSPQQGFYSTQLRQWFGSREEGRAAESQARQGAPRSGSPFAPAIQPQIGPRVGPGDGPMPGQAEWPATGVTAWYRQGIF